MEKISLCMIAKNEEQNIGRCLKSVADAVDEIIVVDTGSSDNTRQVAESFGAKVYSFDWNQNFSDARNASLEQATGDWILFLDADEELARESRQVLRSITGDPAVDGYFCKIINYMGNEGWIETSPDVVFRLFRNRADYRFHGAVHEQIADIILARNSQARYRMAEGLTIHHYGYLDRQIADKDKKNRNLLLLQEELAKDPGNRLVRYHLGVELYRAERFQEAIPVLLEAAQGIDLQTIYLPKLVRYLVLCHEASEAHREGLAIVDQGLRLFPDYADLYYYGGILAFRLREYGRAWEYWQKALAMPEQPCHYASFNGVRGFRSLFYLGQLAEKFCDEDEAMTRYVYSLRDNPRFLAALDQVIRLLRPHADPDYGDRCLRQLCELGDRAAFLQLGRMLFQHGAYLLALRYWEEAGEKGEDPPELKLWKAICLIQQRRYLEALAKLRQFSPGHPYHPQAKLNALLCYWLRGNRRRVRELAAELKALGLTTDTEAVIDLLRDSMGKRQGPPLELGDEGRALLLEILGRFLDLGEKERADGLLGRLSPTWLRENGLAVGKLYLRYGFDDGAEGFLRLALEADPDEGEALFSLAGVLEKQGRLLEAAHHYHRAMAAEPREPRSPIRLSRLYRRMGREVLEEALAQGPEAAPLFALYREVAAEDE